MCHALLSTQLTPELHGVMEIATEQIVRPARGKSHPVQIDRNSYYNKQDLVGSKQEQRAVSC